MLFNRRPRLIERLLIVEDEPLVAFDNEHMLSEAGYTVVATVDSCRQAIAVIDAERLDLVLSDIGLTGERSGVDVALYAAAKNVPTLFVTGDLPEAARGAGLGWLSKPYSERTLKAALAAVDSRLSGSRPGKPPAGLRFFDAPTG